MLLQFFKLSPNGLTCLFENSENTSSFFKSLARLYQAKQTVYWAHYTKLYCIRFRYLRTHWSKISFSFNYCPNSYLYQGRAINVFEDLHEYQKIVVLRSSWNFIWDPISLSILWEIIYELLTLLFAMWRLFYNSLSYRTKSYLVYSIFTLWNNQLLMSLV